jgi:hypothetical protein
MKIMSFAGDLEHLPIVDVIQLLHSTRKTGTLYLSSSIGESQLVFADGFIVSANHVDNSIRIGQILVDMGAITPAYLEHSLAVQKNAGTNRKPLIATLIEGDQIQKEDAYKGLETLIEMSIVEILTWTKGSFRLDVNTTAVSDEYRYFPETLKQEINLNTQNVLMDALRIYDEKMRNGTLEGGIFSTPEQSSENVFNADNKDSGITADLLGLDGLDTLEKKIPDVYAGLRDYEFSDFQPHKVRDDLSDFQQAEQNRIYSYLMESSDNSRVLAKKLHPAQHHNEIILFSRDTFINRIIMTTCKYEGLQFSSCESDISLWNLLDHSIANSFTPLVILDEPETSDDTSTEDTVEALITLIQQIREKYQHQVSLMQLYSNQGKDFSMRMLLSGVDNLIPRPETDKQQIVFTEETVGFLKILQKHIQSVLLNPEQLILRHFRNCMNDLVTFRDAPKLAYTPLKFASLMFERSITFFVSKSELIAKNDLGISKNAISGSIQPVSARIPLNQPSMFLEVIQKSTCYHGECNDHLLEEFLFKEIGPPLNKHCVLIPITSLGKVTAVIYADFGSKPAKPVQIELLDIVAKTAGMALDNCIYRKQLVKQKKPL